MADVYFVKLLSGEQLLTRIKGKGIGSSVTLVQPLELTFSETESGSCIYLSRYCPFVGHPEIAVAREHVVHVEEAVDGAAVYYRKSLEYVQAKTDLSFAKGIADATDYVDLLTEGLAEPPRAEREEELTDDLAEKLEEIANLVRSTKH